MNYFETQALRDCLDVQRAPRARRSTAGRAVARAALGQVGGADATHDKPENLEQLQQETGFEIRKT